LGKIAADLQRALAHRAERGEAGQTSARVLAQGEGWSITDVLCTSGPRDRPFEERHAEFRIAVVVAGSFQYRSARGRALMTPGRLLLGSAEDVFECAHDHESGDRCLSFGYTPEYFEHLAAGMPAMRSGLNFPVVYLPPLRALSPLIARASAGLAGSAGVSWEELSIKLAAAVISQARGVSPAASHAPPSALARVTSVVRKIERQPDANLTIEALSRESRLSPYHFLRTFKSVTRVTPHQYILRTRLREAAIRSAEEPSTQVGDIALDCGFGDLSNFNHAFRAEFGLSPRAYRRRML
jgi:AraC family transcriptional regulator